MKGKEAANLSEGAEEIEQHKLLLPPPSDTYSAPWVTSPKIVQDLFYSRMVMGPSVTFQASILPSPLLRGSGMRTMNVSLVLSMHFH